MDKFATEHIKKEIAILENRLKTLKAYVEIQEKSEPQWEVGDVWQAGIGSPVAIVETTASGGVYRLTGLHGNFGKSYSNPVMTKDEITKHLSTYGCKKIGKLGVV